MFGIGLPEMLVILVIVLIVFGAGKLPEIGSGLGKGIRNFRQGTRERGKDKDADKIEGDKKGDDE